MRHIVYPVLEGARRDDPDPRRRVVYEFDLRTRAYSGRTWQYRVDADFPNAVIGDFTAVDRHRFVLIERDDAQGADARQKKIYLVDLRRRDADGYLEKRLVLDLLRIRDLRGVSLPVRASSAWATRSRSRCSRSRASRSSAGSACSSPTTTTIRPAMGGGSNATGRTTRSSSSFVRPRCADRMVADEVSTVRRTAHDHPITGAGIRLLDLAGAPNGVGGIEAAGRMTRPPHTEIAASLA